MKNILFHRNFHFNIFFTPSFSLLILQFIFFPEMPRNSDQKKELCSSCDKLILKLNMSRHQKLHAKRCLQCSQSFPDDEKLQRHIASKHAPSLTQKKKFSCCSCNSTFSTYAKPFATFCKTAPKTRNKYPTGAYQLSETIFERLEDVKINLPQELRLFSNLIIFDFESITVPDSALRNTELTSWIGKHVPISVSISSNLLSEPIFICNEDPLQLIRDFVSSLSKIAEKSTLLMREKLNDFVLVLEEKYWALRQLVPVKDKQVPTRAEDLFENEAEPEVEEDEDLAIRRLRSELRVISKLRQDFENYYSTIPVFGFNSSRYDLNLIKEYLLHHLLIEKKRYS